MSLSLYEAVVLPMQQTVGSVQGVLEKGAQHYEARGLNPDDLLGETIHSDMFPLTFQLHSVMHHSLGALESVRRGEATPPNKLESLDYAGFQAKLAETAQTLAAMKADQVNDWLGKDVVFKLGEMSMPFTAEGFLFSFAKPNLYFHATTAYDILRMKAVPIGKRDYLGRMQLKR
ncbi:DUF1993 domain-containing protein [Henriciella barbarensis]|uniref:DUF1993 domain-containing protein n=1 Tax=Henriciella barbarensis TaxID=86342 RepID=A0A399QQZ7_9PROT|nr:DUF1993 domain-containing protein [Henriciella barbarensis]RIJ21260.1 DUF1993 domain-containing protein [Henriciella barbarensis]